MKLTKKHIEAALAEASANLNRVFPGRNELKTGYRAQVDTLTLLLKHMPEEECKEDDS